MSIDDVSTVNARGGGIFAANAAVTIVNSTVSQNQATFEGGGIYFVGSGTAKLTNVTVYGNRTTADPAEIRYHDTTAPYAPPYQMKSGFSNAGGGIAVGSGTVELHNTLVAGNVKNIDTSNLILKTTDTTPHTMAHTADDVAGVFSSASSHNLIGYDESTANNINNGTSNNLVGGESVDSLGVRYGINAKVGLLANNGGTVPTHARSWWEAQRSMWAATPGHRTPTATVARRTS